MRGLSTICCVLALFVLAVFTGTAQETRRGPAAERIEQFRKIRLMEALKMDEETSVRFFSRYDKHMEALHAIGKDRAALVDQLQLLIRQNKSDAELEKTMSDIAANDEKASAERERFLTDIRDILPLKKVAEYIVFERNFNQNLREIMREIAAGRWNRGKSE